MAHFSEEDIKARATPIGDGWSKLTLALEDGDTAYCGASTKWKWAGPGTVTYMIHPSGDTEVYDDVVRRVPRAGS
jgi:hypothetical protein